MATVPSSHTFVDGVATSSEANTFIRDPVQFLLNPPIAQLRQIVSQSIADGTSTALTFTAEDVDSVNGHDNATNPSRYTAQYAGWYLVAGAIGWVANATGRRGSAWAVNGALINCAQQMSPATAANDGEFPARTLLVFLNVGDYLELQGVQESGAPLSTRNTATTGSHMSVVWKSN